MQNKHARRGPRAIVINPGDWVWITYSDKEKARKLRKHGHGKPWRHPYRVREVTPHKVRLWLPRYDNADGVPVIMEWQSLRKCNRSPPLDDDDLDLPATDVYGHTLAGPGDGDLDTDYDASDDDDPALPLGLYDDPVDTESMDGSETDSEDNGWSSWTASHLYEIERIDDAKREGSGWKVLVKWTGFPTPTWDNLSNILRSASDPELLADIQRLQNRYDEAHPEATLAREERRTARESAKRAPRPEPTRLQPVRSTRNTHAHSSDILNVQSVARIMHVALEYGNRCLHDHQCADARWRASDLFAENHAVGWV